MLNRVRRPDASEEHDPFARLLNTHRRIEEQLDALERAAIEIGAPGQQTQALVEIDDIIGFFDRAARRHHEDEERSLFPRLRAEPELDPLLEALEAEHRSHDEAYDRVVAAAQALSPGSLSSDEVERLRAAVVRLAEVYRAHIGREERELFPRAKTLLGSAALDAIAAEMLYRRGRQR
jgi:hemerythrin-like domain-containing protein